MPPTQMSRFVVVCEDSAVVEVTDERAWICSSRAPLDLLEACPLAGLCFNSPLLAIFIYKVMPLSRSLESDFCEMDEYTFLTVIRSSLGSECCKQS